MLTKFNDLLSAVKSTAVLLVDVAKAFAEAPNAALACVEMAREAVEYGCESVGEVTKLRQALADMSQMTTTKDARIFELEAQQKSARAVYDDIEQKLTDVEADLAESERKLALEVEARRWRRLDANDNVPGLTPVVFRQQTGSASRDFRTALRMHLTESALPGCEWRYLSPGDMP